MLHSFKRWNMVPLCVELIMNVTSECSSMVMMPVQTLISFFISDNIVSRAIDLVSGLLQQLKILMDDTNAPIWNGSQIRPVAVLPVSHERSGEELKDRTGKKKRKKKKVVHGM